MDTDLAQQAVSAALSGNWKEATKLNAEILKDSPKDIDALNRLARAYAEAGHFKKAKEVCGKALRIDPFNSIANKALAKWKGLTLSGSQTTPTISSEEFLEEPGKTKIISLIHLGDAKLIAKLDSGDEVRLDTHSHRVAVNTLDGKYIGRLPDDISARLRMLISSGNEYKVFIKCTGPNDIKVFIKEVKNLSNVPSFPTEKIEYTAFTPPELVHKNDMEFPSEEEE